MATRTHDSTLTAFQPGPSATRGTSRIASLDIARGVVMILMAIDHVRVYSAVPAGGATAGVFFTRWVTNFSAPAFAFLAGTGAFLYGLKTDTGSLARYLATRGAFLVLLELTVLREAWTFNADFANYNLAGVLWMLGWCMILMAGLVRLPTPVVGTIGLLLVVGQAAFDPIGKLLPSAIGQFLYQGGTVSIGSNGPPILILYVIVPWIGVMAAGYWFGSVMARDAGERRKLCVRIGWGATIAFVVVACAMAVMQPARENAPPLLFRVLGQRKYPASVLFLLMTLGPTIAFLPYAENMRGWVANALSTVGRVPMFFYLLHIPLIHASAVLVSFVREGHADAWLFANHPLNPGPAPAGYRWSLALLYLVFAIDVAVLYFPCRWYAAVKARDKTGLLRYL